jgi:uncharacterized iron-regulated membrane protein
MTAAKKQQQYLQNLRRLHRILAPIMVLPLLLTAITGTIYQIVDLSGKDSEFRWILGWHKGHFGILNLEVIYPFLNALGLVVLLFTGISMWLNLRRNANRQSS